MLEHAAELLCGANLRVPTVYEVRPLSEDEVLTGADFAIWEQRYALKVQRDIDVTRGITRRIREIERTTRSTARGLRTRSPRPSPHWRRHDENLLRRRGPSRRAAARRSRRSRCYHVRLQAGDTFALSEDRVTRFIRRRKDVGDLVEITERPAPMPV